MPELDDSTLVAFVDGELDPDSMREVARAIATDSEAQEKVRLLRLSIPLVRAALDKPEYREVPSAIVQSVEMPAAWWRQFIPRRGWATAVAASIALLIGLGGGLLIAAPERMNVAFEDRLLSEVADYHVVYAREAEHRVEVSANRREHIETWLGRRLNRPLHVPELSDRGWKFEGARLLVVGGRPVAQFIYVRPGDEHHPLGLCITYGTQDRADLRTDTRGDLNLAMWQRNGYAYVLVGWMPPSRLTELAAQLSSVLQNG